MKIWIAEEFNRAYERGLAAEKALQEAVAKKASDTWVAEKSRRCLEGLGMPADVARLLEARIAAALRDALGVGL